METLFWMGLAFVAGGICGAITAVKTGMGLWDRSLWALSGLLIGGRLMWRNGRW